MKQVMVIGAGLAGCEAAWQLAQAGVPVVLYEMRPQTASPAHSTPWFAELVCSNSLRAAAVENAVGLLKEEMRALGSLILRQADAWRLPAGGALAVDREGFSRSVTEQLKGHPLITVVAEEVQQLPDKAQLAVIASGPLTAPALAADIQKFAGEQSLYFYDAAAPIVHADSLDMERIYRASRYGKGEADYLNCPLEKEEYEAFWEALTQAETAPVHAFEKTVFFEGCMPVEAMAARGIDTLRFGPLKPVGLPRPDTGRIPYAVVQLRQDNVAGTLYNLVGFQTHLRWPEQERVFRMIPGLERAQFARFGVMHRNTFINSPQVLLPTLQARQCPQWLFAGQLTGVEGYVESAAAGLVAGVNAARLAKGLEPAVFPRESAHGALCHYITHAESKHFQPMNVNFGLLPPLEERLRDKKEKNKRIAQRALEGIKKFKEKYDNNLA